MRNARKYPVKKGCRDTLHRMAQRLGTLHLGRGVDTGELCPARLQFLPSPKEGTWCVESNEPP